jgi:hypothetical protein
MKINLSNNNFFKSVPRTGEETIHAGTTTFRDKAYETTRGTSSEL